MGNHIFNMFGRSPIRPLQEHMEKVLQSTRALVDFQVAANADDWQAAERAQLNIVELEHEADSIKKDIRSHLPKGLFLPVSRGDLLAMLTMQDRIANQAKDIAGILLGRRLKIPARINEQYLILLQRCIDAVEKTKVAINELDELLETGFRGNEVDFVENIINEVADIEHETDQLQIDVRLGLYSIEQELNPIDVMFLYKVVEWTGEIADKAEQAANRLQLLLAK